MEFNDSQKAFINDSIKKALQEQREEIKWWVDQAEKENDLQTKRSFRNMAESHVEQAEELEEMLRLVNQGLSGLTGFNNE